MIKFENLAVGYKHKVLVQDICAEIPEGTLVALIGRNGTGKSTLLKAFTSRDTILSGDIMINGEGVRAMKANELSRKVSFVGTEKVRIANLKCSDLVALGRAPYTGWIGNLDDQDKKMVKEALEAVGMTEYAERTMDKMSDGECEKIMIARALAQDTPVMILDEPTAFLDVPGRYQTINLLHRLAQEQKKTVIFSTHDLEIAMRTSDMTILIDPPHHTISRTEDLVRSGLIGKVFEIEKYV